jgi:hypothetical protein
MTIILVAGPPLSSSAFHCAGVGHWAFADEARLNAEHWRAAAAGKPGYRLPDRIEPDDAQVAGEKPVSLPVASELARGSADEAAS